MPNMYTKLCCTMTLMFYNMSNKMENMFSSMMMSNPKSTPLMLMTSMIILTCSINLKSSLYSDKKEKKEEMTLYMIMSILSISVFTSTKTLSFFILFEMTMIPMTFILLFFSKEKEKVKSMMFMMATNMMFSMPFLLYITKSKMILSSSNYETIYLMMEMNLSYVSFMIMSMMLVTKYPLMFTHMWLPKAHVEASTSGSMILAGILLKLGTMGMEKNLLCMEMATKKVASLYKSVSVLSMVMVTIMAMRSIDLKKMAAVSSIMHMAMVMVSSMYMNTLSTENSKILMISHGLISPLMFLSIGLLYENKKERSCLSNKSLESMSKTYSMWWFLITMSNMGIPPMSNLICEMEIFFMMMSEVSTNVPVVALTMILSSTMTMMLIMKMNSMKETMKPSNTSKMSSMKLSISSSMLMTSSITANLWF